MEYMDGGALTEVISICQITEAQIACICTEILKALVKIHEDNRIHRDIKSDNILISISGEIKLGKPHPSYTAHAHTHKQYPIQSERREPRWRMLTIVQRTSATVRS